MGGLQNCRISNDDDEEKMQGDMALQVNPERGKGRPPHWLYRLRSMEKRGARFPYIRPHQQPLNDREIFTDISFLEPGERYADRAHYSIKDFARGASKGNADIAKGFPFFTSRSDFVSAANVKHAIKEDHGLYRLIVRAIDGEELITRDFIRDFMEKTQEAVGTYLFWIGTIHHKASSIDKESKHAHIIIRGAGINGEVIRFNRYFMYHGFRTIAVRLANNRLGVLTENGIEAKQRRIAAEKHRREVQQMIDANAPSWVISNMQANAPS